MSRAHAVEVGKHSESTPPEDSLADLLAPPIQAPSRRSTWVRAVFVAWFVAFLILMFLNFVPQSLDIVLNWRLLAWTAWWRGLIWATLVFGFIGVGLAVLYIRTPRLPRESLAIWEAAYYCPRDNLVFIPGYPYATSPTHFHWLIREHPQRWLMRAA